MNFDAIQLVLSQYISYVSVDDLYVLQETIMGIFTQQTFNSWAALSFNASGLMDNKLVCDRVVTVLCIKQNQQDIATHES